MQKKNQKPFHAITQTCRFAGNYGLSSRWVQLD